MLVFKCHPQNTFMSVVCESVNERASVDADNDVVDVVVASAAFVVAIDETFKKVMTFNEVTAATLLEGRSSRH